MIGMITPICTLMNMGYMSNSLMCTVYLLWYSCSHVMLISTNNFPYNVIVSQVPNPAISNEVLKEIVQWKHEGLSLDGIIDRLRPRTVPSGYSYHTLIEGILYLRTQLNTLTLQTKVRQELRNYVQFCLSGNSNIKLTSGMLKVFPSKNTSSLVTYICCPFARVMRGGGGGDGSIAATLTKCTCMHHVQ